MRKGTIVLVPFPFTDLSGQKIRPALVLHDSKRSEDCIVSFISSRNEEKHGLFELKVPMSEYNGLKTDSLVRVNKIATLQKKMILGGLGELEKKYMDGVDELLRKLFF